MADVTWRFLVDWDNDDDFADSYENITDYVLSAKWKLGMQKAYQDVADESTLDLTLRNDDRRFSPEYSSSPYYGELLPQRRVQVESVYSGSTVVHWTGWIEDVQPDWNRRGSLQARMRGVGAKKYLQDQEVYLPLMESVTADEVIQAILQASMFPPATANAWVLGRTGQSELGVSTYLADLSIAMDLEAGQSVFSYVGDNWMEGVDAYQAIVEAVMAERGRFFFDRSGKAVFWNRLHLQTATTVAGTFDNNFMGIDYQYGANIANIIQVECFPRSISATATDILWQNEEVIELESDDERTIRARYGEQESEAKVGGKNVLTPNTSDGSLVVSAGDVSVAMRADASSAELTLVAGSSGATIDTLIIRGRKLTSYNSQVAEARDVGSITDYGDRMQRFTLKLLDDFAQADRIARYELAKRKDPRGEVNKLTLMNRDAARLQHMIDRTIGDRILVTEDQTGHSTEYFIIGEQHELREGLQHHITHWALEAATLQQLWLLGVTGRSELGATTYLGF